MTNIAVLITVFSLSYVWLPRAWSWWRWAASTHTAVTYVLTPTGRRPEDLDEAGAAMSSMLSTIDAHQFRQLRRSGISLHRYREDQALQTAVTVYGHEDPDKIVAWIADAVGATAQPAPDLELPNDGVWFRTVRCGYRGRDPHDRRLPDLGQASDWIARTIGSAPEARVCLTVTLEPMRAWEDARVRSWYQQRSHLGDGAESAGPGQSVRAVVACVSDDATLARTLTSGLPQQLHRWPFHDRGRMVSSSRSLVATGAALLLGALCAVSRSLLSSLVSWSADVTPPAARTPAPLAEGAADGVLSAGAAAVQALTGAPAWLFGLAVMAAVAGAVAWRSPRWPNRSQTMWSRMHAKGVLPVQRAWRLSPLWLILTWRAGRQQGVDDERGRGVRARTGPHPYLTSTLVLNSHHVAQLLAFPAIGQTSSTRTDVVAIGAPPEVTETGRDTTVAHGSLLGQDPAGRPVRILDEDRKSGVFVVGDPGSGKTVAVTQLFHEDAVARLRQVRRDGRSGLLWIETKGEGADEAERLLLASGHIPLAQPAGYVRLDVNAPVGPRLELIDRTDPAGSATRLVAAFTYAFETGSVGPRAAEAMRVAFELALLATPDITEAAGMGRGIPNILMVATTLMSGARKAGPKHELLAALTDAASAERGDHPGTGSLDDDIAGLFAGEADDHTPVREADGPLGQALAAWNYYEQSIPQHRWSELFESPRNKLTAMAQVTSLWTPHTERPDIDLRSLITQHSVGILNFGNSVHGRIDTMTSERLAAITMYLLWEEIKRSCSGWLDDGRSIGIFSDELSHLSGTGSGDDVIGEMHDKGRSFGVQLCLATQRLTQLPARTAEAALGFATRVYMTTENIEHAASAALDLNGEVNGAFSPRDIRELPTGQAAVRMKLRGAGQPPFTVIVTKPDPEHQPPV